MTRFQFGGDCVLWVHYHLARESGLRAHRGKKICIFRGDGYSLAMGGLNAADDRLKVFEIGAAEGAPVAAIDLIADVKIIVLDAGIIR